MGIKRVLKWIGKGLLVIIGAVVIAVATIYFIMGRDLSATYEIAGETIDVPSDAASIEQGQRLAQLRGCSGGCHGRTTEGGVMIELFDGTRVVAPDLAVVTERYSTADLERVIRHGVRPDGTSVIRIMPAQMFSGLSDSDLAMILAYLRSQPAGEAELPDTRYGPVARVMGLFFKRKIGALMAAEVIDHERPAPATPPAERMAFGRYLAHTVCTECHGDDLQGALDGSTPSLVIAASYTLDDFTTLMRTGKPLGDRELDLMADVARYRFVRFTDDEIAALHRYLQTLVGQSPGAAQTAAPSS